MVECFRNSPLVPVWKVDEKGANQGWRPRQGLGYGMRVLGSLQERWEFQKDLGMGEKRTREDPSLGTYAQVSSAPGATGSRKARFLYAG